jgi:eukaryotic-like serine/threonine-protein kinase
LTDAGPMPLNPGTRLGPYEVLAAIGAGGMGEVYRARDTKLGREVAVKILPGLFASDPDRMMRFEREARTLASLNHPHIAQIYGFEETPAGAGHAGVSALVMEMVEGENLSARIARGPIPLDEALPIARQIAEALEAAHEAGIIHRDLKPANIKVRPDGTVKVLDFGLAKLADPAAATSDAIPLDAAHSPTFTSPAMTALGIILGTAAYMAPEQARGRAVDRRADIWAFGCVLFEMLTGRRAFEGDDVSDTLASILKSEPDWTALPAGTPPALRRLLRRCLVKDPARRLSGIGLARFEIDDTAEPVDDGPMHSPVQPAGASRRVRYALATVVVLLAGLAASLVLLLRPAQAPPDIIRFAVAPPPGTTFGSASFVAISPDGRRVAFRAGPPGEPATLWVREADRLAARQFAGTEGVGTLFWSPDSRSIAFFAGGVLKRLEVDGGGVRTISDLKFGGTGAWGPGDVIVVQSVTRLYRVPAAGGPPAEMTAEGAGPMFPSFLPDGRLLATTERGQVVLGSLDSTEWTPIAEATSRVLYAPPGYLVFVQQGRLVAQPFDLSRRALAGDPLPLDVEPVRIAAGFLGISYGLFSVSGNRVLAYEPGEFELGGVPVWVDRSGRELGPVLTGNEMVAFPRLSPDGQRLAMVVDGDIWVGDLRNRPSIRLTFAGSASFSPIWSPDGQRLVYEWGAPDNALWSIAADGSESTPVRVSPFMHLHPHGWSPDGRDLLVVRLGDDATGPDILALPPGETSEPRPILATPAAEGGQGAALSPDGRWLAYAADPTGELEIWVRPFPGPGAPVRVSVGGGTQPVWARNGRELYWWSRSGMIMAAAIQPGSEFDFMSPVALFESRYSRVGQPPSYDVAPDGRFLMLKPPDTPAAPLTVITNWVAEVERRRRDR